MALATTRLRRGPKRATPLIELLEVRSDGEMPDGVCGIVVGVALVYNVVDAYGTRFRVGCLDRTKREKLAAGKVKLFADHEGTTGAHIGYVKALETAGDREIMTGWLFDAEAGRKQKEYLSACLRAGGYTGYSVGFYPRDTEMVTEGEEQILDFVEIELDEVSNTPRPAVPGADALGVRRAPPAALTTTPEAMRAALRVAVDILGIDTVRAELAARDRSTSSTSSTSSTASNARPEDSAAHPRDAEGTDSRADGPGTSPAATTATMDERLAAVRRSYSLR